MAAGNAKIDDNFNPTLTAVSTTDGTTPVRLEADPITGNLQVDASATLTAGTAALGDVNLNPVARGGWTPYFANAVTTTVTVSAAAGKFGGYMLLNLNSAPAYLQVFDTTGAVVVGTTPPTFVIPIPCNTTAANGLGANLELGNGIVIANGIKAAATTTATGASTVATGLTGSIWYK